MLSREQLKPTIARNIQVRGPSAAATTPLSALLPVMADGEVSVLGERSHYRHWDEDKIVLPRWPVALCVKGYLPDNAFTGRKPDRMIYCFGW